VVDELQHLMVRPKMWARDGRQIGVVGVHGVQQQESQPGRLRYNRFVPD